MSTLTLDAEEIRRITGYTQATKQVEELHRQGFYRARRNRLGAVVLERAHYDAVCAGGQRPANDSKAQPRVRA